MLGQALIAARGYTSAETTRAFKRAEALVEQIGDAGQRYSVLYGTFVGHLIGGHIDAATETIDRMYQLACAGGDEAFLCLVYRLRGGLRFFRGDVREAADRIWRKPSRRARPRCRSVSDCISVRTAARPPKSFSP